MSQAKSVAKGSLFIFLGSVLAAFFAYLTKLVLVRHLSVEEYGLFFSVLTFVLFLHVFVSLGLPAGLTRTIAKFRVGNQFGKIKSIIVGSFLIQISMALLVVVVLFFLRNYLAVHYFENEAASWLLFGLSWYLPLNVFKKQIKSLFNAFGNSFQYSLVKLLYNFFLLVIVFLGFFFFSGVQVPLVGYLLSFVFVFFVLAVPVLKTFNIFKTLSDSFSSANKELLLFSLPLLITAVGSVFLSYFDTLLLTYFKSLADVGVYNIIYPTAFLLTLVGGAVATALFPVITSLWESGKKKEIERALSQVYVYVFAASLPLIVLLSFLAEDIIRIFFGPDYLVGTVAFIILVSGSIFKILFTIQQRLLLAFGRSSSTMRVYLLGSVLNIILNILVIPLFGIIGAASTTIFSFLIMVLYSSYIIRKDISFSFPYWKICLMIICTGIIPIALFFVQLLPINIYISTILGVFFGLALYALLIFSFNIVRLRELTILLSLERFFRRK